MSRHSFGCIKHLVVLWLRSYEEDEDQMPFANLGRCLDMDAHGLYCICRIAPKISEDVDTASTCFCGTVLWTSSDALEVLRVAAD